MTTTDTSLKGVFAALLAPFFMALGFILWDTTWHKYRGSAFGLNLFKCNLASIGFFILCLSLGWTSNYSSSTSASAASIDESSIFSGRHVGFLILSATIGIIIGDLAWLEALRLMGATRVLIVDTIKPFAAAFLGRLILHEKVKPIAFLGILLTALGVLAVGLDKELESRQHHMKGENQIRVEEESAMERVANNDGNCLLGDENSQQKLTENSHNDDIEATLALKDISMDRVTRGYIYALLNVLLDTYGALLTKQHGQNMATWAINFIRFGSSGIFMIVISICMRLRHRYHQKEKLNDAEYPPLSPDISDSPPWFVLPTMPYQAWGIICLGVMLVTFLCALLSNYALFQIALALALTLGSVTPLYALVLEWPMKGIRPTIKATLGSTIAVGGVCILAIWS